MPNSDPQEYKRYMNEYMKRRYFQRREHFLSLLGGSCVRCGSTEELDFDHIDSSLKEFSVAKRLASAPMKDLILEMAKCQLLCGPCHHEKSLENSDYNNKNIL